MQPARARSRAARVCGHPAVGFSEPRPGSPRWTDRLFSGPARPEPACEAPPRGRRLSLRAIRSREGTLRSSSHCTSTGCSSARILEKLTPRRSRARFVRRTVRDSALGPSVRSLRASTQISRLHRPGARAGRERGPRHDVRPDGRVPVRALRHACALQRGVAHVSGDRRCRARCHRSWRPCFSTQLGWPAVAAYMVGCCAISATATWFAP
jgi:hypothetical protein